MVATLDESAPLLREPPPPYTVVAGAPMNKPPNQLSDSESQARRSQRSMSFLLGMLIGVLVATTLLQITALFAWKDTLDPETLERLRREFAEDERHRIALREEWDREDRTRLRKAQQWEVERRKHEEDKQHWAEELSHTLGGLWVNSRANDQCISYGTREYTAILDEKFACQRAPMAVHGQLVTAQQCEIKQVGRGHEVVGHFDVNFDEPACRPYWGSTYDKGCVTTGMDNGLHRVESRLWGIRWGDDWQRMCDTAPATINGIEFARPTRCEHRGIFFGMVGIFDYPDPNCGWNSLSGLEETTSDVE